MDESVEDRRKSDIYPNYTEPTAAPSGLWHLIDGDTGCHRRIWPFYTNVEGWDRGKELQFRIILCCYVQDVSMPLSHRDAVRNCTSHAGRKIRNLSNSLSSLEFLIHSAHAEVVVLLVRRIAAEGTPVVCTIHPPSGVILDMFDHVLLLAPGGGTVYFGDTGEKSSEVVEYFGCYGAIIGSSINPAEFILSTVTSTNKSLLDLLNIWYDALEYQALEAIISQLNSTITSREIDQSYFFTRNWASVWRDGMYIFSKMAKSLFVSIFIVLSFFHAGSIL
ncbi:hypothetical protein BDQ94DRAFT_162924 [Aspergillus welwitschiae]|uniref:ABC transporter family G domain-containing protein n=1 Tax=Aspergillus welwitschiae TaxID=1341132 RepID=A0A3F3PNB5_9EURO|nr:hypothetical protein BDQ94DRAFT_162924 [Aspergillus welwitschiae]RDH28404.1 hypothetical protein BDQ94DRAFT_162924 [Aspergillus welwitschiae]